MAGATLSVDDLVAKLQYYKYKVALGSDDLGPLNSPPKVESDIETKDTVLYEAGAEPVASIISKYNAKITIELEDVSTALEMLGGTITGGTVTFGKGVNIYGGTGSTLTFVPYTSDATAETLTFNKVYLQPNISTNFAEGDDPNYITLEFIAKPDDNGVLFTWA